MEADDSGSRQLLKQVGRAIAFARKRAGYTQAVVADRIGLEKETVSRLETGAIAPSIVRLSQFAKLFDCTIGTLFGEHSAAAGEDARAISALIGGLQLEDRQAVMRMVADFVNGIRRAEARRYSEIERQELIEEIGGVAGNRRSRKRRL